MTQELKGTVSGTSFRNGENGWSVVEIRADGDTVVVVGTLPELSPGESCIFSGQWVEHNLYGRQFKAQQCRVLPPTSLKGIERYLGSGLIKGVGPSTARMIVQAFGVDTLEILSERPERLLEISGIGKTRYAQIAESFKQQTELRRAMVFLQTYGLSLGLSEKISKRYRERAEEIVRANPYQLIEDIEGIGFLTADRIALSLGFPENGEQRLRAGIKYALQESASAHGHTYLPREQLTETAAALLRSPGDALNEIIQRLLLGRELVSRVIDDTDAVMLPDVFSCEKELAVRLLMLNQNSQQMINQHVQAQIKRFEKDNGIRFSQTQRSAVLAATQSGVLVITGGPGTGKTTLINCLLFVLGDEEACLLAAPTGRAAKRMSEATGREAKTIHRLLEFSGEDGGFVRTLENPLDCTCLIIDEMSMVDVFLMRSLLRAVKPGTRLILVGDSDQLPSVGPGNVLGDILASGRLPQSRLTEIFRQDEHSMIVHNAHRINRGELPILNRKSGDFFFERQPSAERAAQSIVALCKDRLPRFTGQGDGIRSLQVMSPTKKGACGVHQLNKLLQEALNPPCESKQQVMYGEVLFRLGDKVIHIRNNYQLAWSGQQGQSGEGVFNGDLGLVVQVETEGKSLTVLYDDERSVQYEYAQLEELDLAYCLSVHKSQGSEFETVVMPVLGGHHLLLNRNLFYTAVTRARSLVVLVGFEQAIASMVHNARQNRRYTMLRRWLEEQPALG